MGLTFSAHEQWPKYEDMVWILIKILKSSPLIKWFKDYPGNLYATIETSGGEVILFRDATSRGVGAAPPGGESQEPRPTMIFLFQHPERREWRENTATYGLYEWGSSGFAAAYGISLSRESRDRLYPPLRPIN